MFLVIKKSVILGALLGAISGLLMLLPVVYVFIIFALFFVVGILTIIYLKRNKLIGIISNQDSLMIGSISGFVSLISAFIIYIPIKSLFNIILTAIAPNVELLQSYVVSGVNIDKFITSGYSLTVFIMLMVFVAFLSAMFNALSALVTSSIYEKLEKTPVSDEDKFTID